MSQKPYPKYKDSGVEWLGEIPIDWSTFPLWNLFRRIKRLGNGKEELLSVYRDYGVVPKSSRNDNFNKASEDLSKYQIVEIGDLVINKMKAWQGSVAVSEHNGIVSPAYFVFRALGKADSRFIHFLMRSTPYFQHYASISAGVRPNQWDLDPVRHRKMPVLFPSLSEQRYIAAYLDRETAEIDAFIADQEELIALLSERRTATITQAVTKGLDTDAPMKESGIEWLGDIPAAWSVIKLGWAVRCSSGLSISNGDFELATSEDLVIPVIGGNGVTGYTNVSNIDTYRIVIGRVGALCGNVHLVQEPAWVTDNALRLILDEKFFDKDYLVLLLRARKLNDLADKTAQPLITGSLVTAQRLPHPPIEVQRSIASYVRRETAEIDAAIADAREAITLSKERRAAVISAAVTGKIDVRGLVTPEANNVEGVSVGVA